MNPLFCQIRKFLWDICDYFLLFYCRSSVKFPFPKKRWTENALQDGGAARTVRRRILHAKPQQVDPFHFRTVNNDFRQKFSGAVKGIFSCTFRHGFLIDPSVPLGNKSGNPAVLKLRIKVTVAAENPAHNTGAADDLFKPVKGWVLFRCIDIIPVLVWTPVHKKQRFPALRKL